MKKRIILGASMNEKRFKSTLDENTMSIMPYLVSDNEECFYNLQDCVDLLNEQQTTIEVKDKEIAELDQQCANFLGDKIKALEEFEECTNKLKQKIFDYKFEIKKLKMENDALRYALKYLKHIEVDIDIDRAIKDE